ncbi:MAG: SUMF1/EgtB/PvdO family nonheme iron enzyme [Candidatus Sulfotelmatobacter sp.]
MRDESRLIYIPAGPFTMGGVETDSLKEDDEVPSHEHYLGGFFIGAYAVTNQQMAQFVGETRYTGSIDSEGFRSRFGFHTQRPEWIFPEGHDKYPAVEVNHDEAMAYCEWAGLRLPTESEWEKAARGLDARIFPWGNEWEPSLCCNSVTSRRIGPLPVDTLPEGRSHYGCFNIVGNVWEWCTDWYNPYAYEGYSMGDLRSPDFGFYRILRGGSWCWSDAQEPRFFRCSYRNYADPRFPSYASNARSYGFRVALGCFA